MLKAKLIEVKTKEIKVEEATCDWCGKLFGKLRLEDQPYGEVEIRFGYGSKYDGDKWIAEICDNCFDKHLKSKLRKSENS